MKNSDLHSSKARGRWAVLVWLVIASLALQPVLALAEDEAPPAGEEVPAISGEPVTPEEPVTPKEPEAPQEPEEPIVPEEPETPQVPEEPAVPVEPETPDEPEKPVVPETPKDPQEPKNPDGQPGEPATDPVAPEPSDEDMPASQPGAPKQDEPVDEPVIIPNTDALRLDGEVDTFSLESGESLQLSLTSDVTTPRIATTVYATLTGDVNGVSIASPSFPDSDPDPASSAWTQHNVTEPGASFQIPFVITAPENVAVPQTVTLATRSEARTDRGSESGAVMEEIATITIAATQATPTITCQDSGEGNVSCAIDADRQDVTGGTLSIVGDAGWAYTANGVAAPQDGGIDLAVVLGNGALAGAVTIEGDYVGDGCVDPSVAHPLTVAVDFSYTHVVAAHAEISTSLVIPPQEPVAPTITVQPFDFGALDWDGESWGASEATTTVTVRRDGCGDLGAFAVQVEVTDAAPGLEPVITSVTSASGGVEAISGISDPNAGPVTVAIVASDFTGTGELALTFQLVPGDDAPDGTQQMSVRVSTSHES